MCKSLALVSFDKAKACSAGLHRRCHEVLMGQALDVHRLHFAFTITFHYLFPQLTMGLALLLVYLKTKALRTGDEHYHRAARFWALPLNKWALWQYAHNMLGAVQTGCFVMSGVGSFYLLTKRDEDYGRTFVRSGVLVGTIAALLQLFPTGDMQGKMIAYSQPPTLAAMEGLFQSQQGAPLAILGQPDVEKRRLDNPLELPNMLSFLTYREWRADVKGLLEFPETAWPDQIPLLY